MISKVKFISELGNKLHSYDKYLEETDYQRIITSKGVTHEISK